MNNRKTNEILKNIDVASPCSASWDDMVGDDRVRLCGSCEKNVYNFSEMSKDEVAKLLLESNYSICGQFYRRADGTILTDDCPLGLRLIRQAYRKTCKRIAAAVVFIVSIFANSSQAQAQKTVPGKTGESKKTTPANTNKSKKVTPWTPPKDLQIIDEKPMIRGMIAPRAQNSSEGDNCDKSGADAKGQEKKSESGQK
jgi:hypothetical protein